MNGETTLKRAVKRSISIIILLLIMFVFIGSAFFIAKNISHRCEGESCPICTELASCCNNLHIFGNAGVAGILAVAFAIGFIVYSFHTLLYVSNNITLISLKVELLN